MITQLTSLSIVLSVLPSVISKSSHVYGRFGNMVIPIDFQFGEDVMTVTSHIPSTAPSLFHSTSNLHVFSKGLVAIKDDGEGVCYIQRFNATMDGMNAKVEEALSNSGYLDGVKEELVFKGTLKPLTRKLVAGFGFEIKQFCYPYKMYFVNERNSRVMKPNDLLNLNRLKRDVFDPPRYSRTRVISPEFWDPNPNGPGQGPVIGVPIVC